MKFLSRKSGETSAPKKPQSDFRKMTLAGRPACQKFSMPDGQLWSKLDGKILFAEKNSISDKIAIKEPAKI